MFQFIKNNFRKLFKQAWLTHQSSSAKSLRASVSATSGLENGRSSDESIISGLWVTEGILSLYCGMDPGDVSSKTKKHTK